MTRGTMNTLVRRLKAMAGALATGVRRFVRSLGYYGRGLYERGDGDHIFLLASALSFSLLICLIPFVLILFSAAGIVLESASVTQEIKSYIDAAIPYPQVANAVKDLVTERIHEFGFLKTTAGIIGLIGLFFASSGLFSSMRTILNQVYRTDSTVSIILSKLRDLLLVVAVMFYFLVSTAVIPSMEAMGSLASQLPLPKGVDVSMVDDAAVQILSFGAALIGFFVLYAFVPEKATHWNVASVSAATTAILWQLAKYLFGIYLANAVTLKHAYGAYMFFVAMVLWIYYSSLIFIVGAEVGQLFKERTRESRSA